ncbi:inactive diphosphatase Dcs2p [[Candida] railenensis]|uniref:m7GpppX diphosphatase n=1 Tax=[Candida] railenensis TaxID=45579 RepID=A0A9P0QRU0_9ASCO|nr:inactive diphosphatase Dcs2p [[Candida] railenensis]
MEQLIKNFEFSRILTTNPQTKSIVLLGKIDGESAIVSIEKSHFIVEDEENLDLNQFVDSVRLINENDIYRWSSINLVQDLANSPGAKLNIIYPCTETHIRKYSSQEQHYVLETPSMYEKYTKPYIESMKGDRIKWVYNILYEGKESETFVYHDKDPVNGFVLLPDMKWDKLNMDALYLCCIVNRKDISSIRDIRGVHVNFLESIQQRIKEVVSKEFPAISSPDKLRIFIHYQPSYYHFHIHVVNVKHPGLGDGIAIGKAVLLDDVIENVKLMDDYYEKRSLGYLIGENHGLWNFPGFKEEHYKREGKREADIEIGNELKKTDI